MLLGVVVLTFPLWVHFVLGWSPTVTASRLGLVKLAGPPTPPQRCLWSEECTGKCPPGLEIGCRVTQGRPTDPLEGFCVCLPAAPAEQKAEYARRRSACVKDCVADGGCDDMLWMFEPGFSVRCRDGKRLRCEVARQREDLDAGCAEAPELRDLTDRFNLLDAGSR